MNIVLCGMPGSGKTTVSLALGKLLCCNVYDTDEQIVLKHGEITTIFSKYGEEYFRKLETQAVTELMQKDGVVIATGGGCVLFAQNVSLLKQNGRIVYLRATENTLIKRLQNDTARPLLAGDKEQKIKNLYAERSAVYQSVADIVVDVDNLSPQQIATLIQEKIK